MSSAACSIHNAGGVQLLSGQLGSTLTVSNRSTIARGGGGLVICRELSCGSSSNRNLGVGSQKFRRGMGASCSGQSAQTPDADVSQGSRDFKHIGDEEWKKRLSKEQYNVARQKGTERAFTGQYWNTKTPGTYCCVCCDTPLFQSSTKFDSGTGWPSYWEYISENVKSESDWSIPFMPRTEVMCAVCDAHLGHVFNDGPPPTKKRYCINSASLTLKPDKN